MANRIKLNENRSTRLIVAVFASELRKTPVTNDGRTIENERKKENALTRIKQI